MILKYRHVKISQLVIKILLILASFIFCYFTYKLSKIGTFDSFEVVLHFFKSSLNGIKISYIFIIVFLLINVILTSISYGLFKESKLDDIFNIISTAIYVLFVIFSIEFMKIIFNFLSILKDLMNANTDSILNAIYNVDLDKYEGPLKIAGVFLVLGIIFTFISIVLLIITIANNRQLHFLSRLTNNNTVNPVDRSKKNYSNFNEEHNRNLRENNSNFNEEHNRNLRENNPNQNPNLRNQNPRGFENNKNSFDANNNIERNEDFDKTKILNRDEVIMKSLDRKESSNPSSDSLEIKRGAYDFSSGLKKNSYEEKIEENIDKSTENENFSNNKPFEENEKISDNESFGKNINLYNHQENKNDMGFENTQKNNVNTNFQEREVRKENPNQSNNQNLIGTSKKGQKKFLFIGLGVLAAIILLFAGRFIYYALQPDAEFDTSGVDVKINVEGYSGYANAWAETTDYPILSQYKNKFLKEEIEEAYNQKITLDKEKNIKNGDVITATVEYTALPPYKVSFSDDKIEKKFKVKGLDKFINSYDDISEDNVEKFEGDIQKEISDQYLSDGSFFSTKTKNLEIELAGLYEKKVSKKELENNQGGSFSLAYIYKINYDEVNKNYNDDGDEVEKTKPKETFVVYVVSNIIEKNGAIDYNIQQLYSDIEEADAVNKIKFDGYKEINLE